MLVNKVSLYIPHEYVNEAGNITELPKNSVKWAIEEFTKQFSSCTTIKGVGYYNHSGTKQISKVNTTIAYAFTNTGTGNLQGIMGDICSRIKVNLKQESVAFELNNVMYFI